MFNNHGEENMLCKAQDDRPAGHRSGFSVHRILLSARQIFPVVLLVLPLLAGLAAAQPVVVAAATPTVTISWVGGPINEGESAFVGIGLSHASSVDLYVRVRGRQADGVVYSATAFVAAGKTSGRVPIHHKDDRIWQADGHYDMPVWVAPRKTSGTRQGGLYLIGTGSGESNTTWRTRVRDNDLRPPDIELTYGVGQATTGEGSTHGYALLFLRAQRALDVGETVTVPLAFTGGTPGTDFILSLAPESSPDILRRASLDENTGTVTLTGPVPWNASLRLRLFASEDDDADDEVVTLSLGMASSSTGGVVTHARRGNGRITLLDNDIPQSLTVELSRDTFIVSEHRGPSQPVLELSETARQNVAVPLTLTDGTAVRGEDYAGDAARTVTIPGGKSIFSFDITILDDDAAEGDETFTISIDTASLPAWVTGKAGGNLQATVTILDNEPRPNRAPAFPEEMLTRSIAENAAAGTSVGAPVAATDEDGDSLTYTLGGTDAADFALDAASGQITTAAALDFETEASHSVTVTASDGNGGSATATVTITVTDETEPPLTPEAPTVTATADSTTGLDVSWTEPDNTGRPVISSYDLRYGTDGMNWTDGPQDQAGTSATITGLTQGTAYQVQVRATNTDGDGDWSPVGTGTTNAPDNNAPTVSNRIPDRTATMGTTFSYRFPNNTFTDPDGDTLTYAAAQADGSALPGWLKFDAVARTFTGTPQTGDAGTVSVKVTASDGSLLAEDIFTVTVSAPPPPPDTPVVSIAGGGAVTEGGDAIFTLTTSPAPTSIISVSVTVGQTGEFAASRQIGTRMVTVGTSGTASFTVSTDDDDVDEPDGTITATVQAGTGYAPHGTDASASVTVNDNDTEANDDDPTAVSTLALADATVSEGEPVTVRLTVTPPAPQALTITWRTRPGTATAGTDYPSEATGTVTIPAGAATATFTLATTADRIAEPSETFTVTLAGDLPAHVTVADGGATATITIEDDDIAGVTLTPATLHLSEAGETAPLTVYLTSQPTAAVTVTVTSAPAAVATVTPATLTFTATTWATSQPVTVTAGTAGAATLTLTLASADPGYATLATRPAARVRVGADLAALTTPWLARFGRTVTGQAVTGITTRLTATRTPGLTGTVAGLTLSRLGEEAPATDPVWLAPASEVTPDPRRNPGGRLLTGRDLLAGSAFALTSAPTATGGSYALWGQGAWTHFAGHTGAQAVNGEVLSGTLGADWAQGPWVLGVAVSHTQGEGDATERTHHGTVQSSLTLVTPYVGLDVTDHVTLWGTVGYGRGTLTLTLPTEPEVATDTALLLATGGLRGRLREPDSTGGLALAVRSEARFLRTQAEAITARGLADSEADVGLLRLGLEGAWHQPLAEGGAVIPRLDFGLRQDAGDAEQGFGVEVRGGVRWEAPAHGVTLDLAGQTLLAHSDQGFETWGGAATIQWDPTPGSAAGPALVLRQTYGSVGAGGSPTFWTDAPVALLASPGPADLRVTADFGWGLPLTAGLGVPHVTYGWAPTSRELAFGWRLLPNRARDLTLDLTASHREARRTVPVRQVTLSLTRTW